MASQKVLNLRLEYVVRKITSSNPYTMSGSLQIWALHPKVMKRIRAFGSRVIVMPTRFLTSFLFYCLQDTTVIASTVATSGHYLYQVEFLRCLGNEFYSIQLLHSSGSSIPANLQRLLWHTLWMLPLYEPANQYLFYHYQVSLWRMRA
jgi:hypothetical protein